MTPLRWGLVLLQRPLPIEDEQKMVPSRLSAAVCAEDLPAVGLSWPALSGSVRSAPDTVALGRIAVQGVEADVHWSRGQAMRTLCVTGAQRQLTWNPPVAEA